MAYCLRSFVQTLEQVLHPHQHNKTWVLDHDKIPHFRSLLENATFLRDFLDKSSPLTQEKVESLEDQIMCAAEKAEDTLQSHITSQILSNPERQSFTISPPDLGEVIRVFEAAREEVTKIIDAYQGLGDMSRPVSSKRYPYSKTIVVGVTEDLKQLNSRLTARESKLDIIPIVGMGGTGKTTLARILYDEYKSRSHFDCCAWVTVSQNYDPQLILKTLLACMTEKASNEMSQQQNNGMVVTLHKTLFGRRYLVVIDDIWSCQAWDDMQMAFPRENKGSRIILTTRERTVVNYVKSNSHEMHLLNEDDSWELLRRIVFGEEYCPQELEKLGKTISRNCRGLPLALQVIGGLLSHSQRTEDFWQHVAHEVSSLIAKADDQFSGIFSWSFANLPYYLKPCFLYMGVFPEDHAIRASKVIRMWVAEGFLYPVPDKNLEECAEIHLNALVDRNLIFVRERKSDGKAKSYGIHDLLRELCLKKAHEKKFLCVKDSKTNIHQDYDRSGLRRVIVHPPPNGDEGEYGSLKLTSLSRSIILTGGTTSDKFMRILCYKSSLLQVLNVHQSYICNLPKEFLQLVNLRYLVFPTPFQDLPRNISVFKNLQTLIVYRLKSILILVDLLHLRYLKFSELVHTDEFPLDSLFNPHENLQRLSSIPLETLTGLLGKLPKLRKLVIFCDNSNDNVELTSFEELETLTCWYGFPLDTYTFNTETIFPHSLKKMKLMKCGLSQTLLDAIGLLPELQVLKLQYCILENSTWEPCEDAFFQLQYLKIVDTNLEEWLATEIHFPVLQHLVFLKCDALNEIPSDIGGIETLETIEVDYCRPSVFDSARRISEEQAKFGNTVLQLRLGTALDVQEEEEEEQDDEDDDDDDDDMQRVWYTIKSPKR